MQEFLDDVNLGLYEAVLLMAIDRLPRMGKFGWAQNTVTRILKSEIHLGYVIYGKQ